MRRNPMCFEDDLQLRAADTKTNVRRSKRVTPMHKTKYLQLWITEFSRSKRTGVLVAKETANKE